MRPRTEKERELWHALAKLLGSTTGADALMNLEDESNMDWAIRTVTEAHANWHDLFQRQHNDLLAYARERDAVSRR